MKRSVKKIIVIGVVAGVLGLFFCLYSFLSVATESGSLIKLNSPDETANYFFSKLFAEKTTLGFKDELLTASNNFVHPRSMTVVVDTVRPVSFLGMTVLYGGLSKLFGERALLYYTPFFAVMASLFFFLFVRRIFDERIALLSAILLLIHPAYWYYASRSMMNNVLFVDLLIIGAGILAASRAWYGWLLGGLFMGLSLMVRFSEIIWVCGALFVWGVLCFRRLSFAPTASFLVGLLIPIGILLALNNAIYSSPLAFGYQTIDTSTAIKTLENTQSLLAHFSLASVASIGQNLVTIIMSLAGHLLPFGFVPEVFTKHVVDYGVKMFWWLIPLLLFGGGLVLKRGTISTFREKKLDVRIVYSIVTVLIAAWLVVFYGSWLFYDNITKEITLGNSYVRYWLPMYILCLPFVASGMLFLSEQCKLRGLKEAVVPVGLGVFALLSFQMTLFEPLEGLVRVSGNLVSYREKARAVLSFTPETAVIFSPRSDKIFFPERHVAQSFDDFREVPLVPKILAVAPVFYYGFWNEKDADYVTQKHFKTLGLQLVYVAQFDANERLFQVVPTEPVSQ